MLTNALQRRATAEFDANATPRHGVLLSIEGHPAFVARGKNKPSLPSPASPVDTRPETARHVLEISPASHAKRRVASWNGMAAEIVQTTSGARTSYRYRSSMHLLVLFEQATRREGETQVGELHSSLRDMTRKLVFVPAGHEYRDTHEGRNPTRIALFYIDPEVVPGEAALTLLPRLLFEDVTLLSTAQKLTALIESPDADNRAYLEALGFVLVHELVSLHRGSTPSKPDAQRRPGRLATARRDQLYRGTSRRADIACVARRAGGLEHLSFLPGVQAIGRHAAAPLPHPPADRAGKGIVGEAGSVSHRNRPSDGIQ